MPSALGKALTTSAPSTRARRRGPLRVSGERRVSAAQQGKEPSALARLVIDLAPLIVFFGANYWGSIFIATGAFMIAITIAVIVSLILYKKVSALLWFSAFMVLILGSLTIWFHAEWLIKIKPTLYYLFVA